MDSQTRSGGDRMVVRIPWETPDARTRRSLALSAASAWYELFLRASRGQDGGLEHVRHLLDPGLEQLADLRLLTDGPVPDYVAQAVDELIEAVGELTDPEGQRMWLRLFPRLVSEQLRRAHVPVMLPTSWQIARARGVQDWLRYLGGGVWHIRSTAQLSLTYQFAISASWLDLPGSLAEDSLVSVYRRTSARIRSYALAA
jgi:hypothetical protein